MSEINHVIEAGTLTRDPDIKDVAGKTVMSFCIAQNTSKKDEGGNWVDGEPMFFDVDFWPGDPQWWAKRLGKGVSIVVTGELKFRKWDKDGVMYTKISIRANTITAKWLPELNTPNDNPAAPPADAPPPF
jgi:single-strand DNA-binding protein